MIKHKFFGIISIILPMIIGLFMILDFYFGSKSTIFTMYILSGSLLISTALIIFGVFLTRKNIYIAFINLVPSLIMFVFEIMRFIASIDHYFMHAYFEDILIPMFLNYILVGILTLSSGIYLICINKK